jgi:hypothetical protein
MTETLIDKEKERREKKKAYNRERYLKNREKILAKIKEWQEQNPDYHKKWAEKNKEHLKKYRKEYAAKNRERINERQKNWEKQNFEKNSDEVREARRLKKLRVKVKNPQHYNEMRKKHSRNYLKKAVEELRDSYVQRLLKRRTSIEEVPQQLVEAKRLVIQIRRLANEKRN